MRSISVRNNFGGGYSQLVFRPLFNALDLNGNHSTFRMLQLLFRALCSILKNCLGLQILLSSPDWIWTSKKTLEPEVVTEKRQSILLKMCKLTREVEAIGSTLAATAVVTPTPSVGATISTKCDWYEALLDVFNLARSFSECVCLQPSLVHGLHRLA